MLGLCSAALLRKVRANAREFSGHVPEQRRRHGIVPATAF